MQDIPSRTHGISISHEVHDYIQEAEGAEVLLNTVCTSRRRSGQTDHVRGMTLR